jgi:hypothetical protein
MCGYAAESLSCVGPDPVGSVLEPGFVFRNACMIMARRPTLADVTLHTAYQA